MLVVQTHARRAHTAALAFCLALSSAPGCLSPSKGFGPLPEASRLSGLSKAVEGLARVEVQAGALLAAQYPRETSRPKHVRLTLRAYSIGCAAHRAYIVYALQKVVDLPIPERHARAQALLCRLLPRYLQQVFHPLVDPRELAGILHFVLAEIDLQLELLR